MALDDRLKAPRLNAKPRKVIRSPNFKDFTGLVTEGSTYEADLLQIIRAVSDGRRLPERFYRSKIDQDEDALLHEEGVMHLHLGGRSSDVLVFLVQYADRVVLLEINSHKHFATEPKGTLLRALHEAYLKRLARERDEERAERVEKTRAAIRAGLGVVRPRRPRG